MSSYHSGWRTFGIIAATVGIPVVLAVVPTTVLLGGCSCAGEKLKAKGVNFGSAEIEQKVGDTTVKNKMFGYANKLSNGIRYNFYIDMRSWTKDAGCPDDISKVKTFQIALVPKDTSEDLFKEVFSSYDSSYYFTGDDAKIYVNGSNITNDSTAKSAFDPVQVIKKDGNTPSMILYTIHNDKLKLDRNSTLNINVPTTSRYNQSTYKNNPAYSINVCAYMVADPE